MSRVDSHECDQAVRKRDNTTPSCAVCQRRKVKCDRVYPCAPCRKGRRDCQYLPRAPRAPRVNASSILDEEPPLPATAAQSTRDREMEGGKAISPRHLRHELFSFDTAEKDPLNHSHRPSAGPKVEKTNMMPSRRLSLSRHTAGYLDMRERVMIHGAKPHNASLVGMSEGEWPAFSTTVLEQQEDISPSSTSATVMTDRIVLQPWTFGLAPLRGLW